MTGRGWGARTHCSRDINHLRRLLQVQGFATTEMAEIIFSGSMKVRVVQWCVSQRSCDDHPHPWGHVIFHTPGLRRYGWRSDSRNVTFKVSKQNSLPQLVVKQCTSSPCVCDNALDNISAVRRNVVVPKKSTGQGCM